MWQTYFKNWSKLQKIYLRENSFTANYKGQMFYETPVVNIYFEFETTITTEPSEILISLTEQNTAYYPK